MPETQLDRIIYHLSSVIVNSAKYNLVRPIFPVTYLLSDQKQWWITSNKITRPHPCFPVVWPVNKTSAYYLVFDDLPEKMDQVVFIINFSTFYIVKPRLNFFSSFKDITFFTKSNKFSTKSGNFLKSLLTLFLHLNYSSTTNFLPFKKILVHYKLGLVSFSQIKLLWVLF